jgi:hypothetical protein
MKRIVALALFVCASACGLLAQAVDTTVCDVLKNPESFNGKIVRLKGTVVSGLDQFIIRGDGCGQQVNAIWLAYPPGSKGKAGPLVVLQLQAAHNFAGKYEAVTRTPVTLEKSKEFKQFDSLLAQTHDKGGMCLGCSRYEVSATLVGRLDGVANAALQRNDAGKVVGMGGFGNLNAYSARLVLQSVSDVSPKEEDYSKADAMSKGDMTIADLHVPVCNADAMCEANRATSSATSNSGVSNTNAGSVHGPVGYVQRAAAAMGTDPGAVAAQKDAEAFGKSGEQSGVNVVYGAPSEASASQDAQGTADSPDGVLYNCTINLDRAQGELTEVLLHEGQHIVDLRSAVANEIVPLFTLENNAWVITVSAAARDGMRSLTLPGGSLFYTAKWSAAERSDKMEDGLTTFLSKEEMLSK